MVLGECGGVFEIGRFMLGLLVSHSLREPFLTTEHTEVFHKENKELNGKRFLTTEDAKGTELGLNDGLLFCGDW
jgi:hypothetical protein